MPGVAYAVVRSEPPQVFLATDVDVLHRVLATELVARTPTDVLTSSENDAIKNALLEERWGDAVLAWIDLMGVEVDVYTHLHVYTENDLPEDLIGAQLQFAPLFRDAPQSTT
ncbi:MAG: hypothetical protein VX963_12550 [Actinomycetota bacterium]|nr:hypothetical protein [Acidimicrobiaceae bacterium]MEC7917092.1 hypothetical protein [Actinomycetota bacterium]MEE3256134.1 hypothetical protein [Actinomycetota bacterium]|tara:strand:- start:345 stop:680 length:336 start_codon:yes stop_codon:yes gene_type:complete